MLSEAELKELKGRRTKAKRRLKELNNELLEAASRARNELSSEQAQTLAVGILRERLGLALDRRVAMHSRKLAGRYRTWRDKYAVTLRELEAQRNNENERLDQHFTGPRL